MDFLKKMKRTPQGGKQRRDGREKPTPDGEDNSAAAVQQQQQKHKPHDRRRNRNDYKAAVVAPYAPPVASKPVGETAVTSLQEDRRVDLPAVTERRIAASSEAATAAVYSFDEYGGDLDVDSKAEEYIAAFRNKLENQKY